MRFKLVIYDSEEEMVDELVEDIKRGVRSGEYRLNTSWADVAELIVYRFLLNRQTIPATTMERILTGVRKRWPVFFPEIFESLEPDEMVRAEAFFSKTNEELADEVANEFLKREIGPLSSATKQ